MPQYIVSLKKGLNNEDYEAAHQHARDLGGRIDSTYNREGPAPGFVVDFPADAVGTMEKASNVEAVESNGVAETQ
ncbi:hypothetical protein BGZ57DRAFT_913336 [Hyaloscypha finlandica]|nr:hypothetical protein BGZ57DRAFT_913336 [Hyaloscypha finlandica]